ncbi:MAG: hypothetical protein ABMA26_21160 [Limisphaerales bacterium]
MKTRSPFLALVNLELARSSTIYGNPLAWFLAVAVLACSLMPALLLWLQPANPLFLLVHESWASMMMAWWLTLLIMECSNTLLRGVWGFLSPLWVPPAANSDEFLSTRAIDRALHFRAKTAMLGVFIVLPVLLNFALVCLGARQFPPGVASFVEATPASQSEAEPLAVATAFGGTMIWAGAAAIVLMQGYYGLVSRWSAGAGRLRGVLLACGPVVLGLAGFVFFRFSFDAEHDRLAPVVRFIVRHWFALTVALVALAVVVQRFCERRFAEQEVL